MSLMWGGKEDFLKYTRDSLAEHILAHSGTSKKMVGPAGSQLLRACASYSHSSGSFSFLSPQDPSPTPPRKFPSFLPCNFLILTSQPPAEHFPTFLLAIHSQEVFPDLQCLCIVPRCTLFSTQYLLLALLSHMGICGCIIRAVPFWLPVNRC